MITVCHFSDWHGHFQRLPEADLYVCSGDMLPNFPVVERDKGHPNYRGWKIDPQHEELKQDEFVWKFVEKGGFPALMGNPIAPVVCVRGNHDFTNLMGLFKGCQQVCEMGSYGDFVLNINGSDLRVSGHRGIPFIYGSWNDETDRRELKERVERMKPADLYITHYPPAGVLDSNMPPGLSMGGGWAESWGLEGMANALIQKSGDDYRLTDDGLMPEAPVRNAHCFGHIHECGGMKTQVTDFLFSNAATTINVFQLDPRR